MSSPSHDRASALLDGQRDVLRMIHDDAPLAAVLEKLCHVVEAASEGMLASILLVDGGGKHLQHGAAPSLPAAYNKAIHGIAIGRGVGSCGTAAATGTPVYVEDIATHPYWADYATLAVVESGLRSCWSTPIKSYEGDVIATFAIYQRAPKLPTLAERKLLDFSSHLVAMAVNRARAKAEVTGSSRPPSTLANPLDPTDALAYACRRAFVSAADPSAGEGPLTDAYDAGKAALAAGLGVSTIVDVAFTVAAELAETGALQRPLESVRPVLSELLAMMDVELTALRDHQRTQSVLNDQLRAQAAAIDTANGELRLAKTALESAAFAKSEFFSNMSHEIRTPMNAVIGLTSLLVETPLSEQQRELTSIIRSSGEHLLTVVNNILDFSKIEAGQLLLEARPFRLRDAVEATLDLVQLTAATKRIDLSYFIEPGTPEGFEGDEGRLRQVLLNLVSNAVKFTARGEVAARVSSADLGDGRHELHFAIRDTGVGIPPDRIARLFRPFAQVDASTTRLYGGTGLGLAIVRMLVAQWGGRAWVESDLDRGSTFHFTMAASVRAVGEPLSPPLEVRGKRVLVVDDNETHRRIVAAYAESWGMAALAVSSGPEALKALERETFDLAIVDLHMPDMGGALLAEAIGREADIPLVLLGSTGPNALDGVREGLFRAVVTKPIKPGALVNAVVESLREPGARAPVPVIPAPRPTPAPSSLRVLVVEDNQVNQRVARGMLERLGYRPDFAASGAEAVDAVERRPYDLVFMDIQMPVMDGFDATRAIRARWPTDAERPMIVAMTAHAMTGDREACLAAGMDGYLSKPVRRDELLAALRAARPVRRPSSV